MAGGAACVQSNGTFNISGSGHTVDVVLQFRVLRFANQLGPPGR
jgi:hypothetical protein